MEADKVTACSACRSTMLRKIGDAFDDRYGNPEVFQLVGCHLCGHVMTSPPLTETDLPRLYSTYYPRREEHGAAIRAQAERFGGAFASFRRWLMGIDNQGQYLVEAGDKVLDVGCGSGLSLLEAKALGAEPFGIEADPNVAPLARELGLTIHIGNIFDKPFADQCFDMVTLNQVIEHVASPEATLLAIRDRLSNNGRVVAAFPNQGSFWGRLCKERWLNWHVPFHQNHFNARSFRILAERCGYEVISQRTITPNVWTLMQLRVWREVPVRGVPSPTWSTAAAGSTDPGSRLLRKIRIALLLPLITIVNRTIDALGHGDSLMFELRHAGRP